MFGNSYQFLCAFGLILLAGVIPGNIIYGQSNTANPLPNAATAQSTDSITYDKKIWGWTEADRKKNFYYCIAEAAKLTHEIKARAYCACILEKVELKYPNINDYDSVARLGQKKLLEVLQQDIMNCASQYINTASDVIADTIHWTNANKMLFHNNCVEKIQKDAGNKLNAPKFCECYLDKIIYKYPNYADYMKIALDPQKIAMSLNKENEHCLEESQH